MKLKIKSLTSWHWYLWITDLAEIFSHDLDKVRHGKVHDVVPPGQFQHHIRVQQVIGGKQAGGKALLPVLLQEPLEQRFCQLGILRLRGIQHGILGKTESQ